jgi:Arc/MetJ-type ribon-helix-helix transcriptional regulator
MHPMERQLTVRMPERLVQKLDREALRHRRKRSEVIRLALERYFEDSAAPAEIRPIDRVRDLLGSFESGIPDLGQRHREHLLERLRRGP